MGSNKIVSLADPASAQDGATKNYSDSHLGGGLLNTTHIGDLGKIPITQGDGSVAFADPLITQNSIVSTNNSTTSTLGSNGVYTGTGENNVGYAVLLVNVFADQNSAAGGLQVQQSQDNTNWDISDSWTVAASTALQTQVALVAKFYRIKYTNGTSAQGAFRLQAILLPVGEPTARLLSASGNKQVGVAEALPSGSNIIGQVKVNDGTNVIFTTAHPGVVEISDGTNILGTSSHPVVTDNSAVNQPVVPAAPTAMKTTPVAVNFSSSGDQTVVSAVGGQTIRVMRMLLVVAGATNITFKDSTPTSFSGAIPMLANGSITLDDSGEPWFVTASGKGFVINSSVGVSVQGTIWYTQS
jgi:hypothetical protein